MVQSVKKHKKSNPSYCFLGLFKGGWSCKPKIHEMLGTEVHRKDLENLCVLQRASWTQLVDLKNTSGWMESWLVNDGILLNGANLLYAFYKIIYLYL